MHFAFSERMHEIFLEFDHMHKNKIKNCVFKMRDFFKVFWIFWNFREKLDVFNTGFVS